MMVFSRTYGIIRKRILEIIPHVYQLTVRGVNIILIAEEELTLIDTGLPGSSTQIIDFIHRLGRSVEEISLIIITHNHVDHVGGLAELRKLTPAKVAVHKADISDAEEQLPYPRMVQRTLRLPLFSALRSVFLVEASEVDIPLSGGELLKPLGGLQVLHTPGHTPGSISLFSSANRLLIVADALNQGGKIPQLPPTLVTTDLRQAIDSVKMISQLDFNILCFGHGRPLTDGARGKVKELIGKIKG